jgi:hypothetical protein
MNKSIILILFFISKLLVGQNLDSNFVPQIQYQFSKIELDEINNKLKTSDYKLDENFKKKDFKKYNQLLSKRGLYFESLVKNNRLMLKDSLTNFVQEIADYIVSKNPSIQKKFTVFISRDNSVNASSLGAGYIFVNIGLLERLSSVDQLAFVLCHEMAHDLDYHIPKSVEAQISINKDKAKKKKLKKARKSKYGSHNKVNELLISLKSDRMKHSQHDELIADSLGLELYNSAEFGKTGPMEMLNILKNCDNQLFIKPINIESIFNNLDYKINKEWVENNLNYPFWDKDMGLYNLPDSLRTHPNINYRIEKLEMKVKNGNSASIFRDNFEKMDTVFIFESLHSLFMSNNFVDALYRGIQLKKIFKNNSYIDNIIAYSIYEAGYSIKNRSFLEYVPFPDKSYNLEYNKVLSFLHSLSSKNCISIYSNFFTSTINNNKDAFSAYLNLCFKYKNTMKFPKSEIKQFIDLWGGKTNSFDLLVQSKKEITTQSK